MAKGKRKNKNAPVVRKPLQTQQSQASQIDDPQLNQLKDLQVEEQRENVSSKETPIRVSAEIDDQMSPIRVSAEIDDQMSPIRISAQIDDQMTPVPVSAQIDDQMSNLQVEEEQGENDSSRRTPVPVSELNLLQTVSDSEVPVSISEQCSSEIVVSDSFQVPEATKENAIGQLIDFSDHMIITPGLSKKQSPGKYGKPVQLISNLYTINLPDASAYHYDVQIIDLKRNEKSQLSSLAVDKNVNRYQCLSTKINRLVIDKLIDTDDNLKNSYAVYDGRKNVYTPQPLNLKFPYERKVTLKDEFKPRERDDPPKKEDSKLKEDDFKVIIKPVEKKDEDGIKLKTCAISFEPLRELYNRRKININGLQEAVMALETIFRHTPALKYVPIGRSFFHPCLGNLHPLNGGIQIWFGYYQSCRLGQWKPLINLNTSATTFFSRTSLLDYFCGAFERKKNLADLQSYTRLQADHNIIKKLNSELRNVKIEVTHQHKRRYNIIAVTFKSASEVEFEIERDGRNITTTVAAYFGERYEQLKYPHLPCVQVKPEKAKRFFPLEVCGIIEGQHSRKELSSFDKSEMIKYTAQPPRERFNKIASIRQSKANYDNDEYLKEFNINVSSKPLQVTGRELEAPNINYSNSKFQPKDGNWTIRGLKFYQASAINSWWLLSLARPNDCDRNSLLNFSRQLSRIGGAAGLKIQDANKIDIIHERDLYKTLKESKKSNVDLTVVVIPYKNKPLYQSVKQLAEHEIGIITQCISHENVVSCNPSKLSNLSQKINAKMGGINHILTIQEIPKIMAVPTIIMGADVSHAGVTDTSGISVAAVAGSLDMLLSRFAVSCKLQRNKNQKKKSLEIIVHLKEMVKDLLKAFYKNTRQKPEKIIFFRDGVSEGQFAEVQNKEILQIREACSEMQEGYQPLITFVVVQKRHHTRFMPTDPRNGVGPERNIKPGTVVDTEVVHPTHNDFYLCSHLGLKGTSKPAHYTILHDDNDFTSDQFQALTNYLCYTFVRCSKSISCPVPVRYAHLAAYRIRLILPKSSRNDEKLNSKDGTIPEDVLEAVEISDNIKQRMYFV